MSYQGLADFLEALGQAGQLVRVAAPVDPHLEIAEVTVRASKPGGKALLFGSAAGHAFPVATNLFGDESRICRALTVKVLAEATERIEALVSPSEPEGWFERITALPNRASLRKLGPKSVKNAPCQQVVNLGRDVDVRTLPALQSWPEETGPTITAARLFTVEPESGRRSVGRYDLAVVERNRLIAGWHPHEEFARLLTAYGQRSQPMPIAAVLGGDPAGLLAAMAPLPAEMDSIALAGLFRDKPVEMVKCRTIDLEVPADAEIVIEGVVDPAQQPLDLGPRATANGFYESARPGPVIQVTAITHRANPIYPAIVPGPPPNEQCVIAQSLGQIFLPLVKLSVPELIDYSLPAFGAARHWALVSIRKSYAGQARKVVHALWGLPQLMFTKLLVVVDESVDVRDAEQVWLAVATQADPSGDIFFQQGPRDPWDPATPPGTLAYKVAIDATAKLPGEAGPRPAATEMTEEIRRLVSGRWAEYGVQGREEREEGRD